MRTIHVYTVTKECVVEIEDGQTMGDAIDRACAKGPWTVAQVTFLAVEPRAAVEE